MLSHPPAQPTFDTLPKSGFIRAAQLVRTQKNPNAPIAFAPATLWRLVKAGKFPKPLKLSERVTAWNVGDVRDWMAAQAEAGAGK